MSFQRILVPTDGSDYTKAAVDKAVELAKIIGGSITALYVIDKSAFSNLPADAAISNVSNSLEREGESAVSYVKLKCGEMGVSMDIKFREGSPVNEILAESAEGYDLVVMGTLGRTGMSKLLMGSVAERVVRASTCPIMVVRSKEAKQ